MGHSQVYRLVQTLCNRAADSSGHGGQSGAECGDTILRDISNAASYLLVKRVSVTAVGDPHVFLVGFVYTCGLTSFVHPVQLMLLIGVYAELSDGRSHLGNGSHR